MKQNFTIRRGALDGVEAALAVAEHRNFRKAAAGLGVTPSAMSQAIRSLEARVGAALFIRTTRSVGLTEAGERFLFRGGHQDAEDYCRQYDPFDGDVDAMGAPSVERGGSPQNVQNICGICPGKRRNGGTRRRRRSAKGGLDVIAMAYARTACLSARGPDADRCAKLLIHQAVEESMFDAYSQAVGISQGDFLVKRSQHLLRRSKFAETKEAANYRLEKERGPVCL
jgi:hypothetical protein